MGEDDEIANLSLSMRSSARAMSSIILQVKKLSDAAVVPARGSAAAAGYDLCR
jgi:hypothetical protein